VRPFLLLSSRADPRAADEEYAGFLAAAGLDVGQLRRVRLEAAALPELDLDDYSGVLLGGGPFNSSDPPDTKSAVQHRVEADLRRLLDEVVDRDFPFLGACYGIGTLGTLAGGVVDREFGEPIGPMTIELTGDGRADQLFGVLPESFTALLGHKEAVSRLPDGAVLLASSATCAVQAFRLGTNVYATQFHPELDLDGIIARTAAYRNFGYFEPHEADEVVDRSREAVITEPPRILARFVELFARR
jgi:GMP synthase (glutamine-hydrolysing)